MSEMAAYREYVLVEGLLDMDERALAWAVAEVLQGRHRDQDPGVCTFFLTAQPTRVVKVTPATPFTGPSAGRSTR